MSCIRNRVRAAALTACGTLACFAGLAAAANFGLSNTRIALSASHSVETLVLTSQEGRDVSFEVKVKRWTQKADGTWELVPSQDLVVHPLIVKLPESGTARIRIGSLSPTVVAEQAYRIELNELPDPAAAAPGQIRMLTHVSMPVFVQPANAKPGLALAVDRIDGGDAALVLRNIGTAYSAPAPGKLRVLDAKGKTLHEGTVDSNYVLVGASLPVHAKIPASACARAATIEYTLGDAKPLIAQVSAGARRCAP